MLCYFAPSISQVAFRIDLRTCARPASSLAMLRSAPRTAMIVAMLGPSCACQPGVTHCLRSERKTEKKAPRSADGESESPRGSRGKSNGKHIARKSSTVRTKQTHQSPRQSVPHGLHQLALICRPIFPSQDGVDPLPAQIFRHDPAVLAKKRLELRLCCFNQVDCHCQRRLSCRDWRLPA